MGLWQVVAPDKERVIICEGYIRHELKHGSYVRAEHIVKMFPQFFVRILEEHEIPKVQEEIKVEEIIETEELKSEEDIQPKVEESKKKPGKAKKG